MSLTASIVDDLNASEPGWLLERRRAALEAYGRLPLPSRTEEEWRRTDLKGLDLSSFESRRRLEPAAVPESIVQAPATAGVTVMPLARAAQEHPELVRERLLSLVGSDRDKFTALHAAMHGGGVLVHVADGVAVAGPIRVLYSAPAGAPLALPHTLVVAGRNSAVNVIEEYESDGDPALASGSAEIFAGEGAEVAYTAVQRWGAQTWQFANQSIRAERDATVRVINIGLGGRFSKNRVEASLAGPGARAELKALFFGTGDQFFDYHTKQDHQAPHTTSDLLFKGALRDGARSLYAGLIRIEKGANRSDAYQANRNLLLSERAKADSIPMLEILTNDVRCTHGATVAPVDPMHLFYLVSRGIPRQVAQRMIVQGFFQEILDRIPDEMTRLGVEAELERRID